MKKQSFLTGAVILMIANAISKILGAVFKIPLTYILNEDGMAVFNIAFEVYIMFLSFIISGLPFAISKMVAESNSRGEYSKTHRIVKISTILLVCIGIVGSVALYFAFTERLATSSSARPCSMKMRAFDSRRSARSMPGPRGRAPIKSA